MNQEMFTQLNTQSNNEFYNSFVYLSISNFYYQNKYEGLGGYFKQQAEHERNHAQKITDYLLKFEISADIEIPNATTFNNTPFWTDLFMPLDAALALEKTTTDQINKLMALAIQQDDYATQDLLQWFSREQVDEEHEANIIIAQAKLEGVYTDLSLRLLNDKLTE